MRQIYPLAILLSCLSFFQSAAQFSNNTRMIGASLGSLVFNTGDVKQTVTSIGGTSGKTSGYAITLTPSYAWFLSAKTAIGVQLTVRPSKDKISYTAGGNTFQKDESTTIAFGGGAFLRHYLSASGSFLPFIQAGAEAGISRVKQEGFFYGGSGSTIYKETYDASPSGGFYGNGQLTVGFTKLLNDAIGLDLYAGYSYSASKNTLLTIRYRDDEVNGTVDTRSENETNSKYTNHRFLLGAGFQIFLHSPKNRQ